MKARALSAAILMLGLVAVVRGEQGDGEPASRKVDSVKKLPSSVEHRPRVDGKHAYAIAGIISLPEDQRPKRNALGFEGSFPAFKSVEIDWESRKCSITTTRELPFSELADGIDAMAKLGGFIPYWSELEARGPSLAFTWIVPDGSGATTRQVVARQISGESGRITLHGDDPAKRCRSNEIAATEFHKLL